MVQTISKSFKVLNRPARTSWNHLCEVNLFDFQTWRSWEFILNHNDILYNQKFCWKPLYNQVLTVQYLQYQYLRWKHIQPSAWKNSHDTCFPLFSKRKYRSVFKFIRYHFPPFDKKSSFTRVSQKIRLFSSWQKAT